MRCKSLLALVFVISLGVFAAIAGARGVAASSHTPESRQAGRQRQSPDTPKDDASKRDENRLSIGEIIAMLEQSAAGKISQGDIAARVFNRGINFTPNERAIEQIQQAGAELFLLDTIQRAGDSATQPKLTVRTSDTDPDPDPDQETEREARRRARSAPSR